MAFYSKTLKQKDDIIKNNLNEEKKKLLATYNDEIIKYKKITPKEDIIKNYIENYEERVKQSLLTIKPKNFVIDDFTYKVSNPRELYYRENSNKILGRKGMVYKEFQPDYLRIREKDKQNNINTNINSLNETKNTLFNYTNNNLNHSDVDKEFIKTHTQKYSNQSYILNNHKQKIALLHQNGITATIKQREDPILISHRKEILGHCSHKDNNNLDIIDKKNKSNLNKTYFNAIKSFSIKKSLFNDKLIKENEEKKKKMNIITPSTKKGSFLFNFSKANDNNERDKITNNKNSPIKANHYTKINNNKNKTNNINANINLDRNIDKSYSLESIRKYLPNMNDSIGLGLKKFPLDRDCFKLIQSNPLLYDLNISSLKFKKMNDENYNEKLDRLKLLVYEDYHGKRILSKACKSVGENKKYSDFLKKIKDKRNKNSNKFVRENPLLFFKNLNITVENEESSSVDLAIYKEREALLNTDLVELSKNILYNTRRIKLVDEKNRLGKKRGGKLSHTQGLTIKEYEKKYNLN